MVELPPLFFPSVDSEEGEGFCLRSGSERLILEGWPEGERPGKGLGLTLASLARRSGQSKAGAKHLICLDLAFLLFGRRGRSTVYPESREGLRAPFGKEMHPKKRTPEDLDPMIWAVARIR